MATDFERFADTVGFDLVDRTLSRDIKASLRDSLANNARFRRGSTPLAIFRETVRSSIRAIEADSHSDLFYRFLRDGPYEDGGAIPPQLAGQCLSDDDTARAIRFVYHRIINSFQGGLAELLSVGPCMRLIRSLRRDGLLPRSSSIYVGDAVMVGSKTPRRLVKGADLHVIAAARGDETPRLVALGEVKSYAQPQARLLAQMDRQVRRARRDLHLRHGGREKVVGGITVDKGLIRIGVVPSSWKLPRTFRFKARDGGKTLLVDPPVFPENGDRIEQCGRQEWRVTLKWSCEALASTAYDMTFWYMGKVGEQVLRQHPRPEWKDMAPFEAGCNAAKMMLHYAARRGRTAWERRRAVALYNAYGFGYALGAHFRDAKGRCTMLWPEDLDEILASGKTRHGCVIAS